MKIRLDFVSNSSSSNYVLALDFHKFDFQLFAERVCRNCQNFANRKRDDGYFLNMTAIMNGLKNTCLTFLGQVNLGRAKRVIASPVTWLEKSPAYKCLEHPFENWREDDRRRFFKAAPGVYTQEVENITLREITADMPTIDCMSGTYVSAPLTVKRVIQYGLSQWSIRHWNYRFLPFKECQNFIYVIDRRTVRNTKILISSGYDVKLDGWMDLDKLEACIAAGETIFKIAVSRDGGNYGYGDVYQEALTGAMTPFDGIPVRHIAG